MTSLKIPGGLLVFMLAKIYKAVRNYLKQYYKLTLLEKTVIFSGLDIFLQIPCLCWSPFLPYSLPIKLVHSPNGVSVIRSGSIFLIQTLILKYHGTNGTRGTQK